MATTWHILKEEEATASPNEEELRVPKNSPWSHGRSEVRRPCHGVLGLARAGGTIVTPVIFKTQTTASNIYTHTHTRLQIAFCSEQQIQDYKLQYAVSNNSLVVSP